MGDAHAGETLAKVNLCLDRIKHAIESSFWLSVAVLCCGVPSGFSPGPVGVMEGECLVLYWYIGRWFI